MQTVKEGTTINSLNFMRLDSIIAYSETPYKLRKEPKRFAWLARLAWKLLHKLNALDIYSEKVTTWHYSKARATELADRIMEMRDDLERYYEDPDRYAVVMGQNDFMELMHAPFMREEMVYIARINHCSSPYRGIVRGLPVHVVPWLAGMAVLPKVVIETKTKDDLGLGAYNQRVSGGF